MNSHERASIVDKENCFQRINVSPPKHPNITKQKLENAQRKAQQSDSIEDESFIDSNHRQRGRLPVTAPPNSSNRSLQRNASKYTKVALVHDQSEIVESQCSEISERSDQLNHAIVETENDPAFRTGFSQLERSEKLFSVDEAELGVLMALKKDIEKIKYSHQRLKQREHKFKEYIQKLKAENMNLLNENRKLRTLYKQLSEKYVLKELEIKAKAGHELSKIVKITDEMFSKKIECILSGLNTEKGWSENSQKLKRIDKFAGRLAEENSLFLPLTRSLYSLNHVFKAISSKLVLNTKATSFPSNFNWLSEQSHQLFDIPRPRKELNLSSILDKNYMDFEEECSIDSNYHKSRKGFSVRSKTPTIEKKRNQLSENDLIKIIKDQKYEIELLRRKEHSCHERIETLSEQIQSLRKSKQLLEPGRPLQTEYEFESKLET